ncbi:response regulator [Breznakiella homolactica]|uniref:Sensory/regulatory protein RpfC n=1 Tax=Breznakiella homolactica TaxID=2798577 RepID=A0A7T8B8T1_9SPIR|nr:response regulator [Breznakiella homolactica]QQO08944.1 response regulator [Breznakiella homolactica]
MAKESGRIASPYYRFFKESGAALAVADKDGRIIATNPVFNHLLKTLSGKDTASLEVPLQDFLALRETPEAYEKFSKVLTGTARSILLETPYRNEPGELHWLRIKAWTIREMSGTEDKFQGPFIGISLEDQTKERLEERRLQADKEIAERGMEAKSQFLANMSHEIRTPIQTILGMTELLQDTKLDREQTEYTRQVKFSAEVLLSLINDILDYSKIEAGKMELENIEFDLEQTIEQAVEMIAMEAHKKGLEMIVDIPPAADILVRGDPNKFRQIVINLVKNAVKFTKEGSITISARLGETDGKESVTVAIADTGIGISEEKRAGLFTTFFQGDPSNTRQFGGTGLGLAISRNLVELMQGKIEMVPNEGGGSIFRFTVPLKRAGDQKTPKSPAELKEDRVLVVDDHPNAGHIISTYLRDIGYVNIERASSGEEALHVMRAAAANGWPFTLCFIDMDMPQMDGWRLAAEINNNKEINQARLVLMVPHGLLGADAKMTLLQWFNGYINKPIRRRDLEETIKSVTAESEIDLEQVPENGDPGSLYRSQIPETAPETVPAESERDKPLILIVEDHPVNQKLFSMIMDKLGYPSILADDGLDALEKAADNPVSLIFMDIQMPRMNGYEATRTLRERGFKIPIIAVTASALSDERDRCLRVGIDDVLVKPSKRKDIEAMLKKWIDIGAEIVYRGIEPDRPAPSAAESAPEQVPAAPVFDSREALETFFDNQETLMSLLARFIERTEKQLAGIPDSIKQGDWETGRREAHTIKGSALTLAAKELGQAAARLEIAFKKEDPAEVTETYPPVMAAFRRFKAEAEIFIKP